MNPFNDGKLYEKVGKRYKPVCDTHAYDGLGNGCWLVKVERGSTSIRQAIEPDNAAVEHAVLLAADKIVKILSKASEARMSYYPKGRPLSKREIKASKAYYDAMGGERVLLFEYQSMQSIAEEIVRELVGENK